MLTLTLLILSLGVIDPAHAQTPDFPRTVIDMTGAPVTIAARPSVIGVAGSDPVAAWVIAPQDMQIVDPSAAVVDWVGIGLLIVPEFYAAVFPALIESAEAADVPVFRTIPITSLAVWRDTAQTIGAAAGRVDRAAERLSQLDRQQAALWAIVGDRLPVRVLVLTPEGYTFGQGAWITDLIGAAGGINVAAEAGFADYRQIADSTIRDLAPDVILLAPTWDRATFMQIAAYADLPAVQTGRVIRLPFSPTVARDPGAVMWSLAWVLQPRALWDHVW